MNIYEYEAREVEKAQLWTKRYNEGLPPPTNYRYADLEFNSRVKKLGLKTIRFDREMALNNNPKYGSCECSISDICMVEFGGIIEVLIPEGISLFNRVE
jgi:hypothetical protein